MVDLDETSRRFLEALAGETGRAGTAQSTASEQLSLLRQGGLLASRREGRTVYYRADPAGITAALAELQARLAACCPPSSPPGNAGPARR